MRNPEQNEADRCRRIHRRERGDDALECFDVGRPSDEHERTDQRGDNAGNARRCAQGGGNAGQGQVRTDRVGARSSREEHPHHRRLRISAGQS